VNKFKSEGQRTVLLFGCGGDRDKTKRPAMGRIASELADFVVVTSDNSRSEDAKTIISEILGGFSANGCPFTAITDRREAIEFAIKNAKEGDVILLAGKGHEKYEIDSNGKRDFDEKKIVTEMIEKYY
jgi:UDP-N-acetylmuramyl tripeptide synthase